MPPPPVVDRLDPGEHLQACLLPGPPVATVDQLTLQRCEKALDQGVVEAVADRPHRLADPQPLERAAERQAGVLGGCNWSSQHLDGEGLRCGNNGGDGWTWRVGRRCGRLV